ncbi:hypothetical protein TNCV_3267931 [Trichonephila clavipes]|nr:hypothetical protein TNCV_3267931 [Trichonephila clavipes]
MWEEILRNYLMRQGRICGNNIRHGKNTTIEKGERSRLKEPEGIPEEQRSTGIDSLPQNSLRRRSLSMQSLDGDPANRSE